MKIGALMNAAVASAVIDALVATILQAQGTRWESFFACCQQFCLGGATCDVWIATITRDVVVMATVVFCRARSEKLYRRRRQFLRVAWIVLAVLFIGYLVTKCIARLIYDSCPGDPSSPWFWWMLATTAVQCMAQYKLLKRVVQRARAKTEMDDEDPLLPTDSKTEKKDTDKRVGLTELLRMSAPDWLPLSIAFVCLSIAAVAQAFIPHLTGKIIDLVAIEHDVQGFVRHTCYLLLASLVNAFFTGIRGSVFMLCIARLNVRIRLQLFRALLRQEIAFFDISKSGEITSRLNTDTTKVADQIGLNFNIFLRSVVQAVGVLVFMCWLSWKLTMVTFVSIPGVLMLSKIFGRYLRLVAQKAQEQLGDANSVAQEALGAMTTVRAFAGESEELDRYHKQLLVYYDTNLKRCFAYSVYSVVSTVLPNVATALVIFYGGKLVIEGEISGGDLVSFMLYQQSLSSCFSTISDIYSGTAEALGAADKVFQMMQREPAIDHDEGTRKGMDDSFHGKVELRDVTFQYPARPTVTVLNSLNLVIQPGEVVALVGPSGGGKSSIVKLIERFYEPNNGELLLDGSPLKDYDHKWMHRNITIVSQEPVLFAQSIYNNIVYGLENDAHKPTNEDVIAAAKLANAHDFIMGMPNGYQTEVGEKGVTLSGGQKQRIAIARALVRKPAILLLDEATSALDAESEAVVQQALDAIMAERNSTIVVIAHRLSTVKNADKIVVIQAGQVAEVGRHDELLEKEGIYARLVARQLEKPGEKKNQ